MRNAVLQLASTRSATEQRRVLRAAIRQLDRADLYLAAVSYMDLDDRSAARAISGLRAEVESLRRHLTALSGADS